MRHLRLSKYPGIPVEDGIRLSASRHEDMVYGFRGEVRVCGFRGEVTVYGFRGEVEDTVHGFRGFGLRVYGFRV